MNLVSEKEIDVNTKNSMRTQLKIFFIALLIVSIIAPISYLQNPIWGIVITVLLIICYIRLILWWKRFNSY